MAVRPQPAHIKWPFDEKTAEGLEKNFRTLFQDTKSLFEGVVPVEKGGTGQITFDAGDILYAPLDDTVDGLPIDTTAGRFLRTDGSLPEWSVLVLPNAGTVGDILYVSAANVLSMLADVATGNALISGGVGVAPLWGKIGLTTHVSGILPIANGGTNKDSFTTGSVIYFDGTRLQEDNSGLFFDAANNRLGVGVASPADALDVRATAPIIGARFSGADQFASLRFYEITTLASLVQHIGSTFGTAARRNNLELFNMTATGDITFHVQGSATPSMTLNDSGVLVLANPLLTTSGGTGLASWTQGDLPYYDSSTALSKLAKNTTATRYLSNTGTNNNPAWAQVNLANGVTGTLPTANGGTSVDIASAALPLGSGQITFPATQNASSDANTLDDYEEGTWTPVLTFATPGDLSVAYSTQLGVYTKIGLNVICQFQVQTSTFTHTTASGALRLTGLPFSVPSGQGYFGMLAFNGITKAGYTQFSPRGIASTSIIDFNASGSGVGGASVAAADCPTGGTMVLAGTFMYRTSS